MTTAEFDRIIAKIKAGEPLTAGEAAAIRQALIEVTTFVGQAFKTLAELMVATSQQVAKLADALKEPSLTR